MKKEKEKKKEKIPYATANPIGIPNTDTHRDKNDIRE
jgi:hypothetical protein